MITSWLTLWLLGFGLAPAPGEGLRATFIGNMAFHISDGDVALLTDFPYRSGAFGYMHWSEETVPTGDAPLCLITHSHDDHFAAARAKQFCGVVLGPRDVAQAAGGEALAPAHEVDWRGITIQPIATEHVSLEHYSYLVHWNDMRLYFSGDTEDTSALLEAQDLDVAFVSPWLLRSVVGQGQRIDARRVVVYHHHQGEAVVDAQQRVAPRQGQVLDLGSR